jgi:hypothetical protein
VSPVRRLAGASAARVRTTAEGRPLTVDGEPVAHTRESWLVEDRWWTDRPLRRRYWELVGETGRNLVVYHDLVSGGWLRQR